MQNRLFADVVLPDGSIVAVHGKLAYDYNKGGDSARDVIRFVEIERDKYRRRIESANQRRFSS